MKVVYVFFGFNRLIYREVEYNEWQNRVIYPEEILQLRRENITFMYFQHALIIPLQNIRYDNLRVLSVDINEEIHCYVGDSGNDSL